MSSTKSDLCLQCQKCCRTLTLATSYLYHKDVIEFIESWGVRTARLGDYVSIILDTPCKHITESGCDNYNNRPQICRNFDGREQFKDLCVWTTLTGQESMEGTEKEITDPNGY